MNVQADRTPVREFRHRARPVAVLVGLAVVIGASVVGIAARPSPGRLPDRIAGDQQLGVVGRELIGDRRPALAVACVTPERIRTAVVGTAEQSRFELGSISKGLTGLLFQTMIDSGEVDPDARLGSVLAVRGPLAEVTLTQLATHGSGLPNTATGAEALSRGLWASLTAGNPYRHSVQTMIAEAEQAPLSSPPGTYSNLGFELLGAALVRLGHDSYPNLLRTRVLAPMGMSDALVPLSDSELTDRDLTGRTASGRRADAWLGPAITPVGGVRADVGDTARLAQKLLTNTAPGIKATSPRTTFGKSRIGLAWITTTSPRSGDPIVWHNGGTGGFTSFVGVDRTSRTGVVILSAVQESPDHTTAAGLALLDRLKGCRS